MHSPTADKQGWQLGAETRLQVLLSPAYENQLLIGGLSGLIALCLYDRKPAVIMIVGVNGGGKTTSLGNSLAYFTALSIPLHSDS